MQITIGQIILFVFVIIVWINTKIILEEIQDIKNHLGIKGDKALKICMRRIDMAKQMPYLLTPLAMFGCYIKFTR